MPSSARDGPSSDHADSIRWRPIIVIFLMLFLDGLGNVMSLAPKTRLFEDIVCRQYYEWDRSGLDGAGGPSEEVCKDPAVQDVVARLFGWQTFFDGIPGLVLAMWFGVIADKQGRKQVLFFSVVGAVLSSSWTLLICWLELPLQLVWLSSFFLIIGGGGTVTSAVAMMIITDATNEKSRSNTFFYAYASRIASELAGPALGSALMAHCLWLPLILGLACIIITAALAATIPETLHRAEGDPGEPEAGGRSEDLSLRKTLKNLFEHVYKTLGFIIQHRSVMFLVLTFIVVDFSRVSLGVLLQYLSTRYAIPIAKANLLLSFRGFVQLVTFIAILPLLDKFVSTKLGLSARAKDLLLSRLSIGFIMVCFAILVIAPSIPVVIVGLAFYTLGNGFSSFARSLLSSLVENDMTGTLFTTLSMMDTLGSLLAGPIVAKTFSWSMRLDGIWKGMPYIMSFLMCGGAALALSGAGSAGLPVEAHDEERSSLLPRDTEVGSAHISDD